MSIIERPFLASPGYGRRPIRPTRPVQALVLLAGGSGVRPLEAAVGRSVLDLPLDAGPQRSLLAHWRAQLLTLEDEVLAPGFRAMICGGMPVRSLLGDIDDVRRLEHLQDPQEVRGSGGVLRDVTAGLPDDSYVLVASAASVLLEPLDRVLNELLAARADVALFVHDDHSSPGIKLLRVGCLRTIPSIGFVDFKEQALPSISTANSLVLVRRARPVAASTRTAADYIHALRTCRCGVVAGHVAPADRTDDTSPAGPTGDLPGAAFAESWRPAFHVVEPGAHVEAGARLHDSVVLAGGRVGRDALVVRSIVCPDATVPPRTVVVDQVVQARQAAGGRASGAVIGALTGTQR